jgi:hypothetical protein
VYGSVIVLPTAVVMSRLRTARPSAMAASTDPPSESRTRVALRTSLLLAKVSNSRAVSATMMPIAEIQVRQITPH